MIVITLVHVHYRFNNARKVLRDELQRICNSGFFHLSMGGIWGECSGKRRNAAKCGSIAPQSATMEPLVSKTTVRRTGWAVLRAGAAGCWPHCYGIAASAGGATSATRCARRLKASSGRWLYRADVASFLPPRCFFLYFFHAFPSLVLYARVGAGERGSRGLAGLHDYATRGRHHSDYDTSIASATHRIYNRYQK